MWLFIWRMSPLGFEISVLIVELYVVTCKHTYGYGSVRPKTRLRI